MDAGVLGAIFGGNRVFLTFRRCQTGVQFLNYGNSHNNDRLHAAVCLKTAFPIWKLDNLFVNHPSIGKCLGMLAYCLHGKCLGLLVW